LKEPTNRSHPIAADCRKDTRHAFDFCPLPLNRGKTEDTAFGNSPAKPSATTHRNTSRHSQCELPIIIPVAAGCGDHESEEEETYATHILVLCPLLLLMLVYGRSILKPHKSRCTDVKSNHSALVFTRHTDTYNKYTHTLLQPIHALKTTGIPTWQCTNKTHTHKHDNIQIQHTHSTKDWADKPKTPRDRRN